MCTYRSSGFLFPWVLVLLWGLGYPGSLSADMTPSERNLLKELYQHLQQQVTISTTLGLDSESKSIIINKLEQQLSAVSASRDSLETKLQELEPALQEALTSLDSSEQSRKVMLDLLNKAKQDLQKALEYFNSYKTETDKKIASLELEAMIWKTTGIIGGAGLVILGGVLILRSLSP